MVQDLFHVKPDRWQHEALEAFPHNQRLALVACKGPGKTCVLAWLNWNFLLTRESPKMAAIANSGDNLRDNFWTEMAKWQQETPLLMSTFTWTSERITCNEFPNTWWLSARTWNRSANREQQANTLAGLHAKYCMVTMDESGDIPESVAVAADAILTAEMEGHILQAGNPTMLEGPLFKAATSERHLWKVINITGDPEDPMRSPRVPVKWAQEQIDKYGRDNPWVLVNVFGKFPPSALSTLLSEQDVIDAQKRHYNESHYGTFAKILGVDVARQGLDESVIFARQGMASFVPQRFRNIDSLQGASHVVRKFQEWGADAVMVDMTGGFGAGWYDQMRLFGVEAIQVQFSGKASQPRFLNKRAEMWFLMAEWIKGGGALPPLPEMIRELSAPTYFFKGDALCLEDKTQIMERIGHSPDCSDALALTFAHPVVKNQTSVFDRIMHGRNHKNDYEPYDTRE